VVHSAQPELELNHKSGQRREPIQRSKGVGEAKASRRHASHSFHSTNIAITSVEVVVVSCGDPIVRGSFCKHCRI
jgi:hypothetical protein